MIDKFYRTQIPTSVQIYDATPRTPEPKPYDITKEGHTEWRKIRLQNVDDPELPGDVVNKKYLRTEVGKCLVLENDKFDAKGKSITNTGTPVEGSDVVTKQYVYDNCIHLEEVRNKPGVIYYDANDKIIGNLHADIHYDSSVITQACL